MGKIEPRFEKPIKHQGKTVRCNCNSDWLEDELKTYSFVENLRYGNYICPECGSFPWILVDDGEE